MKYNSILLFLLFGLGLFLFVILCWPIACLIIWVMDFQSPYAGAFLGVLVTAFAEVSVWLLKDETTNDGVVLPTFTKKDEDEQREDDEDEINKDK